MSIVATYASVYKETLYQTIAEEKNKSKSKIGYEELKSRVLDKVQALADERLKEYPWLSYRQGTIYAFSNTTLSEPELYELALGKDREILFKTIHEVLTK